MEANCQIDICRARGPVCRGQNLIVLSVALCMLLGLIGCGGPKLVEAGGTLKFNNQSIGGADVVFVPDEGGSPVIGRTDEQGRFSLSTDGKSGALPGPYKIAITAVRQKRAVKESEAVGMTDAQIAANHESLIPKKYNNTILSGLTAKVSEDRAANVFSLDLK
ncbi:MAG TPA: carboxypeptidase-like regulatory domain-containing protein [Pirellula sp.]|nr:carboxypeptidase-like regulatory domain-containing protein [Pirellula sp.]